MPIGDRPILDVVIRQLARHDFRRITIATGYLGELVEVFFRDGAHYGVDIDYFRERDPLGTVGALSSIGNLDTDFLLMNGDILTDIDYGLLLQRHLADGQAATIAAHTREIEISLGVLQFEGEDRTIVTDYIEKPTATHVASMGIYCFAPRVLEHIPRGQHLDFPDLILRLIAAGETVRAWHSGDYWLDIGRPEDYQRAQDEFLSMRHRFLPEDASSMPPL
jgi:NDP-mannose synthase